MTVRVQWDSDAAKTGLPDVGTDSKTYPNTATAGQVVVTSEQDPTRTITVPFTLPLPVTPTASITPDKTSVDSGGDAAERTITITGTGFPASTAGTVALHPGAPGSGGTAVASTPLTTDASGTFTGIQVVVPAGQAAGDYHLVATVGAVVVDANAVTVTSTPAAPAITPDKTSVDSGGDVAARTITVAGTGFPASTAGNVALHPGAPGSGGTAVVTSPVTSDASGAFTGVTVEVPAGQAAGDYHLVATIGAGVSDDTAITVTAAPVEPVLTADKDTLDSAGDEAERTVTVSGTDFPASTAGRVGINTGAPGTGGTEVVGADVTTDAAGAIAATPLIVPAAQAAGDYHVTAAVTGATVDDLPLTVTNTPAGTVTPDVTTVAAGGTVTVTGTGFPASTAGRVALFDAGDVEIVGADVTTDAAGAIAATPLVVPGGTAAGEYQLNGVVGASTSADVAITVTAALAESATTSRKAKK